MANDYLTSDLLPLLNVSLTSDIASQDELSATSKMLSDAISEITGTLSSFATVSDVATLSDAIVSSFDLSVGSLKSEIEDLSNNISDAITLSDYLPLSGDETLSGPLYFQRDGSGLYYIPELSLVFETNPLSFIYDLAMSGGDIWSQNGVLTAWETDENGNILTANVVSSSVGSGSVEDLGHWFQGLTIPGNEKWEECNRLYIDFFKDGYYDDDPWPPLSDWVLHNDGVSAWITYGYSQDDSVIYPKEGDTIVSGTNEIDNWFEGFKEKYVIDKFALTSEIEALSAETLPKIGKVSSDLADLKGKALTAESDPKFNSWLSSAVNVIIGKDSGPTAAPYNDNKNVVIGVGNEVKSIDSIVLGNYNKCNSSTDDANLQVNTIIGNGNVLSSQNYVRTNGNTVIGTKNNLSAFDFLHCIIMGSGIDNESISANAIENDRWIKHKFIVGGNLRVGPNHQPQAFELIDLSSGNIPYGRLSSVLTGYVKKSVLKHQLSAGLSNLLEFDYNSPGSYTLSTLIFNVGVLKDTLFGVMNGLDVDPDPHHDEDIYPEVTVNTIVAGNDTLSVLSPTGSMASTFPAFTINYITAGTDSLSVFCPDPNGGTATDLPPYEINRITVGSESLSVLSPI